MIYKVKIKDNTKTPFEYASDIETFENGREFRYHLMKNGEMEVVT